MTKHTLTFFVFFVLTGLLLSSSLAQTTIRIEGWQDGQIDIDQWNTIIGEFNKEFPDINVLYEPTSFNLYDEVLANKLAQGSAGDIIACRPFNISLTLYNQGYLLPLNDLTGLTNYGDFALSGWRTDDAAVTYCLPLASVMHGFIYNKVIFEELGLQVPNTYEAFLELLETVQQDGRYYPLLLGADSLPVLSETVFNPVGVNFWNGEAGRGALINGNQSYTDETFVNAFRAIESLKPYLLDGFESVSETQVWPLFMGGFGAIAPMGSWSLSWVPENTPFEVGVFAPPPPAGQECYISDHIDIGMGINANSPNVEAARTFLQWLSGETFAQLYAEAYPGFFPLAQHDFTISDPLANTLANWRNECDSSIRLTSQILRRGEPDNEQVLREALQLLLLGTITPEEAASRVQESLASWYAPQR